MADAFDTAITLLNSADEEKRLEGVRLLGTIKEARAAEALIEFAKQERKRRVYHWVYWARFMRSFYYPPVIEDLRRHNCRLLVEAGQVLVSIGSPAVMPLGMALTARYSDRDVTETLVWQRVHGPSQ